MIEGLSRELFFFFLYCKVRAVLYESTSPAIHQNGRTASNILASCEIIATPSWEADFSNDPKVSGDVYGRNSLKGA